MTNTNVNATLDDLVFEHRNKDYGAYELRKTYSKNITRAFWIGTSVFLIGITAPTIYAKLKPKEKIVDEGVILNLKDFNELPEPPVEQPKPEPPKTEAPKVEIVKYVVPEPVENTENEEVMPEQDKLVDVQIGSINQEGNKTESIIDDTPPVEVASPEVKIAEVKEDNTIFTAVEMQPSFVGGLSEFYKFLNKNLKYPSAAQRANTEGKVYMSFVVEKDGSISDVNVLKGIGFGCDEEALRVIRMMPKWIAGQQNGRNVRVKFTMPVTFKLSE
ncbi:MAG: TonB family protein [Spirosomaceae bacterium]|jgi:protein TonB|nr:TonB family protein [Spirosomataceae bacterium]